VRPALLCYLAAVRGAGVATVVSGLIVVDLEEPQPTMPPSRASAIAIIVRFLIRRLCAVLPVCRATWAAGWVDHAIGSYATVRPIRLVSVASVVLVMLAAATGGSQ
jgi:hypothetical protein